VNIFTGVCILFFRSNLPLRKKVTMPSKKNVVISIPIAIAADIGGAPVFWQKESHPLKRMTGKIFC